MATQSAPRQSGRAGGELTGSLCALQDLHKNLEQKLAQFHEREDCILYASCFDANAGLFEVPRGSRGPASGNELS